jgi:hypothetical protein
MIVDQLVTKSPGFNVSQMFITVLEKPTIGLDPDPYESNPYIPILFIL